MLSYNFFFFFFYTCRFAFIEFPNVEEAKEAMESCNNTEVEGRTIRLEYSQSGGSPGGDMLCNATKFKLEMMMTVSDYP